jgi:hypothetical protein
MLYPCSIKIWFQELPGMWVGCETGQQFRQQWLKFNFPAISILQTTTEQVERACRWGSQTDPSRRTPHAEAPQDSASPPPLDITITDLSSLKGRFKAKKPTQACTTDKDTSSTYKTVSWKEVLISPAQDCAKAFKEWNLRQKFEDRVWETRPIGHQNVLAPRLPSTNPNPHAASYIFGPFSPSNYMGQNPRSVLVKSVMGGAHMSCWATQFLHQTQMIETCSCMSGGISFPEAFSGYIYIY